MTAASLEATLAGHPFFEGIDLEALHAIAEQSTVCTFDAGRLIFRQGEPANQFYLITSGTVALEVYAPDRGAILLMTLGAGDVLGWSWLFPPYVWHLDARASEATKAIALDGASLRSTCEANHELGYHLMKHSVQIVEQRLQAALLQLIDLYRK